MKQAESRFVSPVLEFNRALSCDEPAESLECMVRAAEAGCVRAQFLAGLAYHLGKGVAPDYDRAARWYQMAAGSGEGHAIANIAVMSLLGQGRPVDDLDAYIWAQSAVGLGHTWLRPALEVLEARITEEHELSDAQEILRGVVPEEPVFPPCSHLSCDRSQCNLS